MMEGWRQFAGGKLPAANCRGMAKRNRDGGDARDGERVRIGMRTSVYAVSYSIENEIVYFSGVLSIDLMSIVCYSIDMNKILAKEREYDALRTR
jgi:hypothetical protein